MFNPALLLSLQNNRVFQGIMRRAYKLGAVEIYITGVEKYDHEYSPQGEWVESKDHSDGSLYDIEGHSWTDIHGFFDLSILSLSDWSSYFRAIGVWLKDSWELKSLDFAIKTLPFFMPWSQWMWTVCSFDSAKHDAAEAEILDPLYEGDLRPNDQEFLEAHHKAEERRKTMTDEDAIKYLESNNYVQLREGIYVSTIDPTNMYVNESLPRFAFNLKDGWSNSMIGHIIGYWLRAVGHGSIDAVEVSEDKYNKHTAGLLKAIAGMNKEENADQ
jgi:hypothetical protein